MASNDSVASDSTLPLKTRLASGLATILLIVCMPRQIWPNDYTRYATLIAAVLLAGYLVRLIYLHRGAKLAPKLAAIFTTVLAMAGYAAAIWLLAMYGWLAGLTAAVLVSAYLWRLVSQSKTEGPLQYPLEIVMALLFALFGAIIIYGALRHGITWSFDGPRAGFFPFIVGALVCTGAVVTLVEILMDESDLGTFADWNQITQVVSVALPTLAYIILIYIIGIYIASALLIAYFMTVLSRFSIMLTATISIAMPIVTYFVFEKWFLVALPQGKFGEQILGTVLRPIARLIGL